MYGYHVEKAILKKCHFSIAKVSRILYYLWTKGGGGGGKLALQNSQYRNIIFS